jgi:hypothetical protein
VGGDLGCSPALRARLGLAVVDWVGAVGSH